MKIKFLVIFCIILFVSKSSIADEQKTDISIYTGTFDIIDKEGDDQTSLIGLEHRNSDLFRNTFLGKFKPLTGIFMTGNSSVYLYTGVEGQYDIGPLKILPSFSRLFLFQSVIC